MDLKMAVAQPSQSIDGALAARLGAALERCDTTEIELTQGKIFGLHAPSLSLFVAARLASRPRTHGEEVFGQAALKIFSALQSAEKVRKVGPGGSFAPLFFTITRHEIADYWRGRPPYGEDRRSVSGIDAAVIDQLHSVETIEDLHKEAADAEQAASIMDAVGGLKGLDGLLLELTIVAGLRLVDVEKLLHLAELPDAEAATQDAAALLDVDPILAGQYLELIRECPSARSMSYNALKVAVHRARRRAGGAGRGDEGDR